MTDLREIVDKTCDKYADRKFIYWEDSETKETTVITFSDYKKKTNKVANMLYDLGIRKGDIISTLIPNSLELTYLALGVQKIGAIFGPVNNRLLPDELHYITHNNESSVLITTEEYIERVEQFRSKLPYLKHLILIGDSMENTLNYSELMQKSSENLPPEVEINADEDPAFIVYTGGTTGFPKGALLTHKNVIRDNEMVLSLEPGQEIPDIFSDGEHHMALVVNPLFHVNALISSLFLSLTLGGPFLLVRKFSASNFWRWVEKYKITNTMVVPAVLAILLKVGNEKNYDISSLKSIVSAAAPLPVELRSEFQSTFNIAVIPGGLGMTEVSSGCFGWEGGPIIDGSVGKPLKGVEVKIVDQNDPSVVLGPNEPGELILRGPHVMKGYFKNPEGNSAVFLEGNWLRTGDVGYFDNDGYLFLGGRSKDMIIRGGENIYPIEIEEILHKYKGVSEAVVIGKPDKIYGQVAKAFVTMKPEYQATEADIIEFCKNNLADYKVPVEVEFRDSLPKSKIGKPDKKVLQEEEIEKSKL